MGTKIRLLAVTDIRGTIALAENDRIEWGSPEDKKLFKEITTQSGVVVMGRKTYETIGRRLPGRCNIVLSSKKHFNCESPDLVLNGSVNDIVQILIRKGFTDICVIGGQSIFSQFLKSGMVTDLHLTIEPIILPDGLNLFSNIDKQFSLRLEKAHILNSKGSIYIHYRIEKVGSKI
ncbi:dihydrofolate reductase family protein [Fervidobacterium sp.]